MPDGSSTPRRVGVLAATLQQENPRGVCRAARAIAERLVQSDRLELIALEARIPDQPRLTYLASPLAAWLEANPMELPTGSNGRAAIRRWVPPALLPSLGRMARPFRRPARAASSPPVRALTLDQLDDVLCFWWFWGEPFYQLPVEIAQARIIGWFHDATPIRVPGGPNTLPMDLYRQGVGLMALKADRIVCVSESSERDLVTMFPAAAGKTTVIHHGHLRDLFNAAAPTPMSGSPYFVCVGIHEETKNLPRILLACRELKRRRPHLDFKLVLAGAARFPDDVDALLAETRRTVQVQETGYISTLELASLLRSAVALVFPSLWEGFGMPVLEAMSAGTPVITSDIGALAEVCGRHALYCDPYEPSSIARAMETCLDMSSTTREQWAAAAAGHAAPFTWEAATLAFEELLAPIKEPVAPRVTGSHD